MTERKPREITFASWVDQQISEAAERGAFDDLPGAGKPISRRGGTDAWLQDYLRREGVSADELLPTPLRLRKEVERLAASVQDLRSEQEVREVVKGLNRQIAEWRRLPDRAAGVRAAGRRGRDGRPVAGRAPRAAGPGAARPPAPGSAAAAVAVVASPELRPGLPSARAIRPDAGHPDADHRACRTTAFSSSWLSGTGLPCMLLDVAALAAMLVGLPGAEAERGQPGHAEQA